MSVFICLCERQSLQATNQAIQRSSQVGSRWSHRLQKGLPIVLVLFVSLLGHSALAEEPVIQDVPRPQPEEPIPPESNPLELTEPDPLLPELVVDRPLSPQERRVLSTALDELNTQAQTEFESGNIPEALDIWNRELRLRRFLGPDEEVKSLSRVGEVAWRENQITEVRVITQRLQQIQQEAEAQSPTNYDLLMQIAQAYQTLRAKDQGVALYEKLLVQAQQEQNVDQQKQILAALGEMNIAWFDYPGAASAYERLLALAESQGDSETEIEALRQLSQIYQDSNQLEPAIAAQQRLVDLYQDRQMFAEISALKQAIGDEYLALGRPELAATSYQEAFAIARSSQQYAYAADALQRLANLYISLERLPDALVVYELLLDVKQQAYDTLGTMNTYDQIGQIHRALGNSDQAIEAFRQALQIAQQLDYKVSYFTTQIQELGGQ
ncbi:MAG: tetratricopeptide repeat protein [Cyanobacteria bacterium CRU_2_1]|nr:tetratricopeptide repeat protein [Cyanobacteria bacterium RU_5_0]NJR61370.1 tetratricopeptide repeat protein [Cyanobacteria bacterium CRU_2_1]